MMLREQLQFQGDEFSKIKYTNCPGNEAEAQVVWLAQDHVVLRVNEGDVSFINRNFRVYDDKQTDEVLVEGVPLNARVTTVFDSHVNAYGWDNLDRIEESRLWFGRAIRARELLMQGRHDMIPKDFYDRYQHWLDLCIERNVKDLTPTLEKSLNDNPETRKFVIAGLGHFVYDPSIQLLLPQGEYVSGVFSSLESRLNAVLGNTSYVVSRAKMPEYLRPLDNSAPSSRMGRPQTRSRRFL